MASTTGKLRFAELLVGASSAQLAENRFSRELLRESQRLRTSETMQSLFLSIAVAYVFLLQLGTGANPLAIFGWVMLNLLGATFRWRVCETVRKTIVSATPSMLFRNELRLAQSTVILPILVGLGFWIVAWNAYHFVILAVALCSALYAIGSTFALSIHYRTFVPNLTLNLGQAFFFFLLLDTDVNIALATTIICLWLLLLHFGRRNSIWHANAIRMRLEIENQNTLLEKNRETIEAMLKASELANESKSHFIAAASHDLRQPLHAMSIFIGSLKDTLQTPEQREIVDAIDESANKLRENFTSILDLSRLEAGAVNLAPRKFNLADALEDIVAAFIPIAERKGLSFKLDAESVEVVSDPNMIHRLLQNLVDNAIRFTKHGEVCVKGKLQLDAYAEPCVCIRVEDSGIGILKEDRTRIFEPYVQVSNPERNPSAGTGLGLAIVKRIVDLMEGQISVESEIGQGTRYSVSLPMIPDEKIVLPALPSRTQEVKLAPQDNSFDEKIDTRTVLNLSGKNFLVVDDDVQVLNAVRLHIERRLGTVWTADCLEEALAILETNRVDLILLDDMLHSNYSGTDIAEHARSKIDQSRIVFVSGNESKERINEIRKMGYSHYRKPLSTEELDLILEGVYSAG